MTTVRLATETRLDRLEPPAAWAEVVRQTRAWGLGAGIELRDAVMLLPFAQLLPLARHEFGLCDGWLPRIETTRTLAEALGPPPPFEVGQISFDVTVDTLSAAQWLQSLPWAAAWARRDPRGFERATSDVVRTAHDMARAAAAIAPDERAAHWAEARTALFGGAGPGSSERLLARVALEWASLAPAPATDRLFELRPAAWIVLQAGGLDGLTAALLRRAEGAAPCLVIDTDAADEEPFAHLLGNAPTLAVCDSFETEAQSAAAQILADLRQGMRPVALIAQDRSLMRRIRALLERRGIGMLDETGWKLSTSRAAVQVVGLLKCAGPDATTDDLLDWLKSVPSWPGLRGLSEAVAALEANCRRGQLWRIAEIAPAALDRPAWRLWDAAMKVLAGLARAARQPLGGWLRQLAGALDACGSLRALKADAAGRQVLGALHLLGTATPDGAWQIDSARLPLDLAGFSVWVVGVLERETFLPAATATATTTATATDADAAEVVITPLARAMLRPFAAMVFPAADDRHLGAIAAPHPLLSDAQAAVLGVPTAQEHRRAELLAFAQILRTPRLTLLRRRLDGADPLADSPLVERLALALKQAGRELAPWRDVRDDAVCPATPVRRSAPSVPELLPQRLTASGLEALRSCPYRFLALNMLRLHDDGELDGEIEKRDFGNWLHEVLQRFHAERAAPQTGEVEVANLHRVARQSQAERRLADADFLPFTASFATFAPRYVAWLHQRDAAGAAWQHAEYAVTTQPEILGGTELHGIIDRIDSLGAGPGGSGGQAALELIDYKTGSLQGLKEKVRAPLEDTQLAFYAALVGSTTQASLNAIYLVLDNTKGIEAVAHPDVARSAAALLHGLAHDLARLRAGAGMQALGEAPTCDYCEVRGVCRRDHWSVDEGAG